MSDNENSGGPGGFDDEEFDFLDEGEDFEASTQDAEPEIAAKPEPKPASKPALKMPPKKVMYIAGGVLLLFVIILVFTGGSGDEDKVAETEQTNVATEKAAGEGPKMSQEDIDKAFGKKPGDELAEAAKPEDLVTDFSQIQEDLFGPGDVPPVPAPPPIAAGPEEQTAPAAIAQEKLDTFSKDIDTNELRIQELQNQLMQISKTLANVNQSIQKVDNRVGGLSDSVESINTDLTRMKKIITDEELDLSADKKERDTRQAMLFRTPKYVVHAIIPGRAWLKSTEGQIITVTEGDTLGDYGKVAAIDAGEGIVLTTSGMAFR